MKKFVLVFIGAMFFLGVIFWWQNVDSSETTDNSPTAQSEKRKLTDVFNFSKNKSSQQDKQQDEQQKSFTTYDQPEVPNSSEYTVLFVGDSMIKALGPYPYIVSNRLNEAYPEKGFIVENYAVGSQRIDELPELIRLPKLVNDKAADVIIDREYDILIVGSFAYNPFFDMSLEDGLDRQEEVLDEVMLTLTQTNPNGLVIFLATIAPSRTEYAKGVSDISDEDRAEQANQRRAYIENFIEYAEGHNIPLVDVYNQSLDENGVANTDFISFDDNIHPSQVAVEFIQNEIADFIIENEYLPK